MAVRPLEDADLPAVVAIYNEVMETTSAIWSEQPTSLQQRRRSLAEASAGGHPSLVADDGSSVVGFITAGPFRAWPGYARTCEHSIHVSRHARGQGVGGRLLAGMERALRARGVHVQVAGIDAANDGSLRFHARAGFVEVARMPEVGLVRGAWRDLVLVQKILA